MRIGIDVRLWDQTGVGRYIRNLVIELVKIDHKNSYVLFALPENITDITKNIPGERWQVVSVGIKWHSIAEQVQFPAILKKQRLDLVHFPYFSVPIFNQDPYVITIHDLIIDHFDTGEASTLPPFIYKAKRIAYKNVIRIAAKKSQKIISVSESTKNEIIDHLHIPKEKIIVTYEGVDIPKVNDRKNQKDSAYFLYVGNAYPHKNLERLIDSFEIIVKTNKNTKLYLVGKEDYFYKKLKTYVAEKKLSNEIIFKGYVSDSELSSLYVNAEAVIVPSLMEGFGLPALEAMASGVLVLASDIPAIREVCGKVPIYFDPADNKSISEKLQYSLALPNQEKQAIIRAGLEQAKKYSWKKMAQQTLQIYESCTGVRSGQ